MCNGTKPSCCRPHANQTVCFQCFVWKLCLRVALGFPFSNRCRWYMQFDADFILYSRTGAFLGQRFNCIYMGPPSNGWNHIINEHAAAPTISGYKSLRLLVEPKLRARMRVCGSGSAVFPASIVMPGLIQGRHASLLGWLCHSRTYNSATYTQPSFSRCAVVHVFAGCRLCPGVPIRTTETGRRRPPCSRMRPHTS